MASISHNKKTGRRTVQFVGRDRRRHSIRLGRVTARQAETAKGYIEDLVACLRTGSSPRPATADWVAAVPDIIRDRLERCGLVGPRQRAASPTLGQWLADYFDSRSDVKESTRTIWGHTRRNLLAFFGSKKALHEITPGDADAFRVFLKTEEGLADNTVRRRLGIAKQFFLAAVRRKLVSESPFEGQTASVRENPKRYHFVTRAETEAVLAACPGPEWRLAFALCRFGGLRCPSEVTRLTWEDVDWANRRFTVHPSKTEHHADGGIRIVPIFPELLPYFRDAFEAAEPGEVYCCPQYANGSQMYRKQFLKILKQAGLTPWPKLFQNCRSSRETELTDEYPVHVACAWIGNSPRVAAKHYLQVTEEHFQKAAQKAVQNPVQHRRAQDRAESALTPDTPAKTADTNPARDDAVQRKSSNSNLLGATGLEPVASSL